MRMGGGGGGVGALSALGIACVSGSAHNNDVDDHYMLQQHQGRLRVRLAAHGLASLGHVCCRRALPLAQPHVQRGVPP